MGSTVMPYVVADDYAAGAGLLRDVLHPAQRGRAGAARSFPPEDARFHGGSDADYDVPAVTLTTYRDVVVRGRSNILTAPDAILRHGLVNLTRDLTPEEFYGRLRLSPNFATAEWARYDIFDVGYLPEAAVFTDGVAFNYAHWMTEVLPRIAAFGRARRGAGTPIIIDADLHPNIMRSIALAAGPDVVLRPLAPEALVRVGVLHNVSPTGYVPFKWRRQSTEGLGHGVFSPSALQDAVARLREASEVSGRPARKLFVRRNAGTRAIENHAEIEAAVLGRGFEVIEPERLTFDEQVAAFSSARTVLGATGAAMVNLMFCRPDCPAIVLMPRFRQVAFWYWGRISAAAGAGPVLQVSGDQVRPNPDPFDPNAAHQDFRIDMRDLFDALDAAEGLNR